MTRWVSLIISSAGIASQAALAKSQRGANWQPLGLS